MSLIYLDDHEPGPVALSPNRFVYYTGKVAIGLRFEPRYVEQGSHAELIQRVLTTKVPRVWFETPRIVKLKPSLIDRLRELLR